MDIEVPAKNRRLFAYKITRDYGFAPNPFFSVCSLATCKPNIRKAAQIGDWVVGVGSEAQNSEFAQRVIYAMEVHDKITFDEYWNDPQFLKKRPQMNGSLKVMYGDNIYHRDPSNGEFIQEDSHHSLPNGEPNPLNLNRDTRVDAVLISKKYWYWGKDAVPIPDCLKQLIGLPRDYKRFDESANPELFESLEIWLNCFEDNGYISKPALFGGNFERYSGN